MRGKAGVGGAKAGARCDPGLLLSSVVVAALLRGKAGAQRVEQDPLGNWASPRCNGSLCLDKGNVWGPRFWIHTS